MQNQYCVVKAFHLLSSPCAFVYCCCFLFSSSPFFELLSCRSWSLLFFRFVSFLCFFLVLIDWSPLPFCHVLLRSLFNYFITSILLLQERSHYSVFKKMATFFHSLMEIRTCATRVTQCCNTYYGLVRLFLVVPESAFPLVVIVCCFTGSILFPC